jgi:hypothetical protein
VINYLIRLHLPDRPGALGAVASRIGSVGGDVGSIEILERRDGKVVDELGVGLPGDHLIDLLRAEILEVDGVAIESLRSVEGALPDRHAELLDVAAELFKQRSSATLLDRLTALVRKSLAADFAAVLDTDTSQTVSSDGRLPEPETLNAMARQAMSPPPYSVGRDDAVAAASMIQSDLVLIVGRVDPVLRDRERQWMSIMAEIADDGCQRPG